MELRSITRAEKIQFYRDLGFSEYQHNHVESDGTVRTWTREEWEENVVEFWRHPDLHEKDLSYIAKRRELYPDEVEQLDVIWKILSHLRKNGIDLGEEGSKMLDRIELIKSSIPKFS